MSRVLSLEAQQRISPSGGTFSGGRVRVQKGFCGNGSKGFLSCTSVGVECLHVSKILRQGNHNLVVTSTGRLLTRTLTGDATGGGPVVRSCQVLYGKTPLPASGRGITGSILGSLVHRVGRHQVTFSVSSLPLGASTRVGVTHHQLRDVVTRASRVRCTRRRQGR